MLAPARLACLVTVVLLASSPAFAEDGELSPREQADALVRDGARFGEQGKWDDAIRRFRAAESKFPRAVHDCNIGLAYSRSARPNLALHYLRRCEVRATEPVPAWVETRRTEALEALRQGAWTPLEVAVRPLGATFTVDTLPGETFAPVGTGGALATLTLWLQEGAHTLQLAAAGHISESRSVLASGRSAVRVEVALAPVPEPVRAADPSPVAASSSATPPAEPAVPSTPPAVEAVAAPSGAKASAAGVCHRALPPGDGPDQYPGCLGDRGPSALAVAGWTGLGLGVALGVVSSIFYRSAVQADDDDDQVRYDEAREIHTVSGIAAAVAGGVGLVMLAAHYLPLGPVDERSPAQLRAARVVPPVSVGLSPAPGGGLLTALGRF